MFDISPEKFLVFLLIAFVVLGPGRFGEVARGLGRARAQLRQFTGGISPDTAKLIRDPRGAIFDALAEPHHGSDDGPVAATQEVTPQSSPVPATQEVTPQSNPVPATQEVTPQSNPVPATQEVTPQSNAVPATQVVTSPTEQEHSEVPL